MLLDDGESDTRKVMETNSSRAPGLEQAFERLVAVPLLDSWRDNARGCHPRALWVVLGGAS